ncbi:MAG: NAD(P)H-hydrate dehydratase [Firmicutes bacterium]|nr:NAD(P)H-hydrate dehydratase [Bacillota bacterium]
MIGVDVIRIDRIKKAAQNASFWRVFTVGEREYIESKTDKFATMAGIFAAKEAAAKAFGRGFKNIRPDALEVLHDENGRPYMRVDGKTLSISISHDGEYAAATAFLENISQGAENAENQRKSGQNLASDLTHKMCDIISVTKKDAQIPKRERFTHKGDYARVFIVGGSAEMPGAPFLSFESACAANACIESQNIDKNTDNNIINDNIKENAENLHKTAVSALKSGAGLVTLCVPQSLKTAYQVRIKQEMLFFMPDNNGKVKFDTPALDMIVQKADVIVIGPGMGENTAIIDIIAYLCKNFDKILIVDADGLNALSRDLGVLNGHKCRLFLTPHIGEFLRLGGEQEKQESLDLAYKAADFAVKHDCMVVLKSAYTYITDGVRIYKNTTGTAAMAKGGTGDVLAGMIAAFTTYMSPLRACLAACYHLGKNGERAERAKGSEGVLAEDLYL